MNLDLNLNVCIIYSILPKISAPLTLEWDVEETLAGVKVRGAHTCLRCLCDPPHLEVDMDVVSQHIDTEELAAADLTGVFFVSVSQQVFVHVTATGKHLVHKQHLYNHTLPVRQTALNTLLSLFHLFL